MSETKPKLTIPRSTVLKLKDISSKFSRLNTGNTSDEFWLGTGVTDDYSWTQHDLGVNKSGQLIHCEQGGCSCNSAEQPTADETYELGNKAIRLADGDSYSHQEYEDAVNELIEVTNTIHKVLNDVAVSAEEIIALPNAEVRRAAVEIIGYDKIVETASVIDESEDGKLLRIPLDGDEDIVIVHVKDPSTTREYFLRVPPDMKTAKQARAWTFGFEAEDFELTKET